MKFLSVTFDLDGTLLDTAADLTEACRRMMLDLDLPPHDEAAIRRFVGQGMLVLVRRCLGEARAADQALVDRAVAAFRLRYAEVNGQLAQPYPGVIDGLDAWQATGLPLAVVTNKPAAFTEPLLVASGLAPYFRVVVSGDTTAQRKPHPEPLLHACRQLGVAPASNLHIGDSRHDIATARAAGSAVYCVPYGYNEGEPVAAADCDALVPDLLAAWQRAHA